MKPRVVDAVPDLIFEADDYNEHQDRTKDLTKCNGVWLVNEPDVWCHTGTGSVTVGAHYGLVIAGVELAPKGETNVALNSAFAGTGWYYLYAKNDGSDGVAYEWDDDVPDDGVGVLDGGTRRRVAEVYVLVATAGAEQVRPFRYAAGVTIYRWTGYSAGSLHNAWRAGTTTGTTNMSLVTFIPPTSRTALIMLLADQGVGAVTTVFAAGVQPKGDVGAVSGVSFPTMQLLLWGWMSAANDRRIIEGPCETDENLDINAQASSCTLSVYVRGYKR